MRADRLWVLMLVSAMQVTAAFAQTKADTNREVIRTYAQVAIEEKNYPLAEKIITQYVAKDAQDPTLWNLLGLSQMAQQKFGQSCYAFKKSSDLFKPGEDRDNSVYNYADCLNRGNQPEEAKKTLQSMIDSKSEAKNTAQQVLEKFKSKEIKSGQALPAFVWKQRGHLRVAAALGSGYDTNVLLVSDASAGGVSNEGSAFLNPALQVGYWGDIFGQRFDSRLMASFTDYLSESARTFNLMYERIDFILGKGDIRYGLVQEMAFINRDPFQLYFLNGGFIWQKKKQINDREEWDFDIPIKYRYFYSDRTATTDNVRDGIEAGAKVSYFRVFNPENRVSTNLNFYHDFTQGKNYRMSSLALPVQYNFKLPLLKENGISNVLGAEGGYQQYWQSTADRSDWSLKLNTGLSKQFFKAVNASLDYSYQKNKSSVEAASYRKHQITLMLSYNLL